MKSDPAVERATSRLKEITSNLPKGRTAAEQFDNMMVYLHMAVQGLSEEEVRRRRKAHAETLKQQEIQESMAETCP